MSLLFTLFSGILFYGLITCILYKVFQVKQPFRIAQIKDQKLKHRILVEYVCLYNSFINAVLSVITCFTTQQIYGFEIQYDSQSNSIEKQVITFILSYFVFDTFMGFLYNFNDTLMRVHHVYAILQFVYCLYCGRFIKIIIYIMYIGEFTGIFLQLYSITQYHNELKKQNNILGVIFSITYLFLRGPVLSQTKMQIQRSDVSLILKFGIGFISKLKSIFELDLVLVYTQYVIQGTQQIDEMLTYLRESINFQRIRYAMLFIACFSDPIIYWNHKHITQFFLHVPKKIQQIQPAQQQQQKLVEYVALYNSLINAVYCVVVCFAAQSIYGLDTSYEGQSSPVEKMIMGVIFGYFLFDTALGIVYKFNIGMMLIHHIAVIIVLAYALVIDRFYQPLLWCMYIGEITGIFLQIYTILEYHKKFQQKRQIFGIIFCVLFLYFRGPYLYYMNRTIQLENATIFIKLFAGLISILIRHFKLVMVLVHFQQTLEGRK